MKTREQKEMDALEKFGAIEIGERRGRAPNTRHCIRINRVDRTITSVSTMGWREGEDHPNQTHTLSEWLALGFAW